MKIQKNVTIPELPVVYTLARLLAGLADNTSDNGIPEPWNGIIGRLAAIPIDDRKSTLEQEVRDLPSIEWSRLLEEIIAIDPNGPIPVEVAISVASPAALPPVEPFPVDALPRTFGDLVSEGAESIGCPPDYIGVPLLCLAGAAVGTSNRLQVKRGWYEQPSLYTAIVGPSGTKKTPAKRLAAQFTEGRARELHEEHALAIERHNQEMAVYEDALADYRYRRKGNSGSPYSGHRPQRPERPALKRTWVADTTVEALSRVLKENLRGVALIRDELSGFLQSLNQYKGGRGSDVAFFLSSWSGESISVDRKGDIDPILLHRPFLAIVGGVQPGVLPRILDRDRQEDGMAARFLFAYPDVKPQHISNAVVSDETVERVNHVFEKLFLLAHANSNPLAPDARPVRLSATAQERFAAWHEKHNQYLNELTEDDPLRAPMAKMPGQLARLSLTLHCVDIVSDRSSQIDSVSEATIEAAIRLAEYFISHAGRVWRILTESQDNRKTRRLMDWIRRKAPQGATKRDVVRYGVAGIKTADEAGDLLSRLEDAGLLGRRRDGKAERYVLTDPEAK